MDTAVALHNPPVVAGTGRPRYLLIRGACMILMAGLVTLPIAAVGVIGILIMAAHNLLDSYDSSISSGEP